MISDVAPLAKTSSLVSLPIVLADAARPRSEGDLRAHGQRFSSVRAKLAKPLGERLKRFQGASLGSAPYTIYSGSAPRSSPGARGHHAQGLAGIAGH